MARLQQEVENLRRERDERLLGHIMEFRALNEQQKKKLDRYKE